MAHATEAEERGAQAAVCAGLSRLSAGAQTDARRAFEKSKTTSTALQLRSQQSWLTENHGFNCWTESSLVTGCERQAS